MNAPAQTTAVAQSKPKGPADFARAELEMMTRQFENALPKHIPVERFKRVVMTAIQNNPDLMKGDRKSLWNACIKAASDGLLPDGREGAMVPYKGNIQWLPMIAGVLKKVRNSGELSTIVARVVCGGDIFRNWIDDEGEHILYEKSDNRDPNTVTRVFAMAKLKDGSLEVEDMTVAEIEKVRAVSMAGKSGPWVQWWDEMAKKTVLRRLAKRLPSSTDLDDLMRRDDELYDFGKDGKPEEGNVTRLPKGKAMLDKFAAGKADAPVIEGTAAETADPDTGELPPKQIAEDDPGIDAPSAADAYHLGQEARRAGIMKLDKSDVPANWPESQMEALCSAWAAGWNAADADMEKQARKPTT